ncbi:MAG TPA: phosphate acetyltransferase PlsX, partial [Bacillota bacterium]
MRIAIDAVGGDQGPAAPIAGALAVLKDGGAGPVEFVLIGPEALINEELRRQGAVGRFEIIDTPDVIGPEDSPAAAVRRKRGSSIVVGTHLVARREVDAFLSAGNTGALMVAAKLELGSIEGIERPALATLLPTWDGQTFLMLDLGAQADCTPTQLYQFGLMGSIYMERVVGRPRPRVALLNIGAEAGKGGRVIQEAYRLLENSELNFRGNIEGRNLLDGVADVV